MSSVQCRLATIDDVRSRIEPLLRSHWEEVARHRDTAPLNPCWEYYYASEKMKRLVVVAAEDGTDLVGYNVYFLLPMLHNMPKLLAQNDIIYVRPAYRQGSLAMRLIHIGEEEVKRLGASFISMHVKPSIDFSKILIHTGYAEMETIYIKAVT